MVVRFLSLFLSFRGRNPVLDFFFGVMKKKKKPRKPCEGASSVAERGTLGAPAHLLFMAPKRRRSEPSAPAAAHRVRLAGEESALASKLSAFRKQGKLTDVTVRASGTDFAAHRNVLAAASSYFDARFGSGMRDSDDAVVVLDDMPSAVFECVLDRACVRGHRWRAGQFLYPL